ncbi:Alkanal monooxygenase alpha chain [Halomicronema hongdechloris C2206]|uniref:Alkanal monooxygenase alpha chain n=1 Tax=Halomicronema hongdechloris C2206 TaxID=1641165 RepID=A0A1Z3HL58_9CYAN|nr:LLM class flavin-dependent oxidoreductase [Halomicronema hongdechloris]ASC71033.1 Alkanal monooxygenase alpha chain [Halomicronema hongdechloris C2206]
MDFSLFYFSGDGSTDQPDKYRLLLESAKFAELHHFSALWTPERHFHPFGGLYPNPSLTSAALAMITERVRLRAGSVVMPLHNPARVAEEWAVVDNLSQGRVDLAFASGWTLDDFVLSNESYGNRKDTMWNGISALQKLWAGEPIELLDPEGKAFQLKTFPKPLQPELPTWIVCQSTNTFLKAGEVGANVLTSLLSGNLEEVAAQIQGYRQTLAEHGHDPHAKKVAMMLHTFVGDDFDTVKEQVRQPFYSYLKTHLGLLEQLAKGLNVNISLKEFSDDDINSLLSFAYEGWLKGRTLIGSQETCATMVKRLEQAGVDEAACLIDFNPDVDAVMSGLPHLKELKDNFQSPTRRMAETY